MISSRWAVLLLILGAACGGVSTIHWENDDGNAISEVTGSQEHCGWQSISFLYLEDHRYVGDPEGVLGVSQVSVPYLASTQLPEDAEFSGYRDGDRQLWTVPDDEEAVYIVDGKSVERWPEVHVGCD